MRAYGLPMEPEFKLFLERLTEKQLQNYIAQSRDRVRRMVKFRDDFPVDLVENIQRRLAEAEEFASNPSRPRRLQS